MLSVWRLWKKFTLPWTRSRWYASSTSNVPTFSPSRLGLPDNAGCASVVSLMLAARNHAGVEAADLVRLQADDALHAVDDQVIELHVPARAVARADRDRNGEAEAVERLAALLVRVESTDRHLVAVRRVHDVRPFEQLLAGVALDVGELDRAERVAGVGVVHRRRPTARRVEIVADVLESTLPPRLADVALH